MQVIHHGPLCIFISKDSPWDIKLVHGVNHLLHCFLWCGSRVGKRFHEPCPNKSRRGREIAWQTHGIFPVIPWFQMKVGFQVTNLLGPRRVVGKNTDPVEVDPTTSMNVFHDDRFSVALHDIVMRTRIHPVSFPFQQRPFHNTDLVKQRTHLLDRLTGRQDSNG